MRIFKQSKEKVKMSQYTFQFLAVRTVKRNPDDPDYLLFHTSGSNKVVGSMRKSGSDAFEISIDIKAEFDVVALEVVREVKDQFGKDYIEDEDGTLTEIPKFREI